MRGYLASFRNRSTASGIGESPASQRRTVLSSLNSTSAAKRRADKPDASIAFASRSRSDIRGDQAFRLCAGVAGDTNREAEAPDPTVWAGHSACSVNVEARPVEVGGEFVHRVGDRGEREGCSHWGLRIRAGRDCPDTREGRASALKGNGPNETVTIPSESFRGAA